MYIAVTIKRYRAVKGVGEIKMSVGITAYYQVMQICQAEYFRQLLKPVTQYSLTKLRSLGFGTAFVGYTLDRDKEFDSGGSFWIGSSFMPGWQ